MLFTVKKLVTPFLLPPGIFILLLLIIGLAIIVRRHWRGGIGYLFFGLGLYALSISPVANRLVQGLEADFSFPVQPTGDVIVLLGGGTIQGVPDLTGTAAPTPLMMGRIVTAVRLYRQTKLPVIITGGRLSDEDISEAQVAKRFLLDLGVPEDAIIKEALARDTAEKRTFYGGHLSPKRFFKAHRAHERLSPETGAYRIQCPRYTGNTVPRLLFRKRQQAHQMARSAAKGVIPILDRQCSSRISGDMVLPDHDLILSLVKKTGSRHDEKDTDGAVVGILMVLWACAASPPSSSSVTSSDQGDRELKRGIYWYQKGCMRKAMDHFHAAHEHYSLDDQQTGIARSLNSLANIHRQQDRLESAHLFYDAAVAAARRCDDRTVLAQILTNKAAVLIDENQLSAAGVLLDEAELLTRERSAALALVLNYHAVLMMKANRNDKATALLDRADTVDFGNDPTIRATLGFSRGRLMMKANQYRQAKGLFAQALELDRQADCSRCMADDLAAMADVHERLGENEAALDCLERSLKIYALLENPTKVNDHLDHLERLADETGADIRVTVHFIKKWLAGEAVDAICR